MGRAKATVRLWGGLGNQLFQYYLALWLRAHDVDACLDVTAVGRYHDRVGIQCLEFGRFVPEKGWNIPPWMPLVAARALYRTERTWQLRTSTVLGEDWLLRLLEGEHLIFPERVVFQGFFQHERIVGPGLALGRPELKNKDPWFLAQSARMEASDANVLHVRRGDFGAQQGMLSARYYAEAMDALGVSAREEIWVFSDSPEQALKLLAPLKLRNVCPVQAPRGTPAATELLLMSEGRKVIASNSTFSWWAARLSPGSVAIPTLFSPSSDPNWSARSRALQFAAAASIPPSWE